jgi:signal transduction histidine kinase
MGFNRYRLHFWVRLVLLLATAGFMAIVVRDSRLTALPVFLVLLAVAQAAALLRVIEKPQRDVNRFLEAIQYSDFTQTFSETSGGKSLAPMREAFSKVVEAFQKTRVEKEAHFRTLQTVVQHVGVGLLSFAPDGRVDLSNHALRRLFGLAGLKHVDDLARAAPGLPDALRRMVSGETARISIPRAGSGDPMTLSIHATRFVTQGEPTTLVSIANIQSELEEKELEAWQTLMRVLTHEIMNSITPIASLASTAKAILSKVTGDDAHPLSLRDALEDAEQAVMTIETRSQGLLKFVQAYRLLAKLPKPDFKIVGIQPLFQNIRQLMQPKFLEKRVRLEASVNPASLEITADPGLIEQVLINLLQNALDWCKSRVVLSAFMGPGGKPTIQVSDDGPGIQPEALEKVFIPFFTTKKDGSGIGLSLSRQIMRLHKGSLSAQSEPGQETVFTLRF